MGDPEEGPERIREPVHVPKDAYPTGRRAHWTRIDNPRRDEQDPATDNGDDLARMDLVDIEMTASFSVPLWIL